MTPPRVRTVRRYDRIAPWFDRVESWPETRLYSAWRPFLFEGLNPGDRVLEIGVGTGRNFAYYPPGINVEAIDFSSNMLDEAKTKRAADTGLHRADIESLPFKANTFHRIVGSFVFCSIPDPVEGARSIARVLHPNGDVRLVEHVRSQNAILAAIGHALSPFTRFLFGYSTNRDTAKNLEEGGLQVTEKRSLWFHDVFTYIQAHPPNNPSPPPTPHL